MKEPFIVHNFRPKTLGMIALMEGILTEYAEMGYVLTVRQLYYQMVARDHIPNNMRSYKRLVGTCGNARKAGLLDWAQFEDTARRMIWPRHWRDPAEAINWLGEIFRIDRWERQPNRVMVMVEKEALAGILQGPCEEQHVRLFPNRGYTSLSYAYLMGKIVLYWSGGLKVTPYIIYLGDHDPSGMDMDNDLETRIDMFSDGSLFNFERIALTMPQIEQYDPPPDPAKLSDSRADAYVSKYGYESWELDALSPQVLVDLLEGKIEDLKDLDIWEETMEKEGVMAAELAELAVEWEEEHGED